MLQIFNIFPSIALKISLEVFQEKGWINANENKAIQEYCNNAKQ